MTGSRKGSLGPVSSNQGGYGISAELFDVHRSRCPDIGDSCRRQSEVWASKRRGPVSGKRRLRELVVSVLASTVDKHGRNSAVVGPCFGHGCHVGRNPRLAAHAVRRRILPGVGPRLPLTIAVVVHVSFVVWAPRRWKTIDSTRAFRGFSVTAFTLDGKTCEVDASVLALGASATRG